MSIIGVLCKDLQPVVVSKKMIKLEIRMYRAIVLMKLIYGEACQNVTSLSPENVVEKSGQYVEFTLIFCQVSNRIVLTLLVIVTFSAIVYYFILI